MQFFVGLAIFSTLFIGVFVIGLYLVFGKTWLVAWLRANIGILFLFFGLSGGAGLVLLADMHSMDGEVNFGTVKIHKLGLRSQFVRLNTQRLGERDVELIEENWRLRAIYVKWTGLLPMLGVSDGVLLYDLQQSDGAGYIRSEVIEHEAVVKVWEFGRRLLRWLPGIHFEFLATEWYPKNLNTVYDLKATKAGFTLKDRLKKPKKGTAQALLEENIESNVDSMSSEARETGAAPAEIDVIPTGGAQPQPVPGSSPL